MNLSKEGLDLIRKFEGFRSKAYRDATGVWTVGYGHTSMAGPPEVGAGLEISRKDADRLLEADAWKVAKAVSELVTAELTANQFSALVSFAFNVGLGNFGASSVLKAVNAGDLAAVPRRLQLWTKAGGRTLPGLVRRRAAEAELFIGGAGMPRSPRSEVDRPAGKKLQRSTTTLAAILSALAGMASTVLGTVKQAKIIFGGHSTLILLTIVALATLWIIRERYLKARDEGV